MRRRKFFPTTFNEGVIRILGEEATAKGRVNRLILPRSKKNEHDDLSKEKDGLT